MVMQQILLQGSPHGIAGKLRATGTLMARRVSHALE